MARRRASESLRSTASCSWESFVARLSRSKLCSEGVRRQFPVTHLTRRRRGRRRMEASKEHRNRFGPASPDMGAQPVLRT